MSLTIAWFTNRIEPKVEWFFRTLRREVETCNIDVGILNIILIDFHAEAPGRREDFAAKFFKHFGQACPADSWHVTPKPCVWQGAHRLTKNHHFAASNARNTAFAMCRTDFIACVDDLSVLMSGWLSNVWHAKQNQYIVMGAYKKVLNLDVGADGLATWTDFPQGVDSRWHVGTKEGIERRNGTLFFGCSFALPIEAALTVNGFDELCDAQGAEDYDFGIRLERSGRKLFYNRNMLTLESEELHGAPGNQKFIREAKIMNWNGSNIGSDHVMLQRVTGEARFRTLSNEYDLRQLRAQVLAGQPFPVPKSPTHDWRDGAPLSTM